MPIDDERAEGLSRRDFLKSAGLASVAAVPLQAQAAPAPQQAPDRAQVLGPGLVPVRLLVNGTERKLRVEPRTTLALALREGLGLTGTKIACDRGACGACTVWIDGQPATSCMILALDVAAAGPGGPRGAAITTIEGLAHGDRLHEVQQAFIEQDALQCGYCTPGMIMSCAALVEKCWAAGAVPDEPQVRGAVAGNLCRCGTYPHVLRATLEAASRGKAGGAPKGGPR